MKKHNTMNIHQLVKFAHFLGDHPSFAPLLTGEDLLVCGFQIGECFLSLAEMDWLIGTPAEPRLATLFSA